MLQFTVPHKIDVVYVAQVLGSHSIFYTSFLMCKTHFLCTKIHINKHI